MRYQVKALLQGLILSCLLLASLGVSAAEKAGTIRYMSGTLVAQRSDGSVRVLSPKSSVQPGDLLVTGKRSYAQVVMNDGTKMTMRPDSNLKIEAYEFKSSAPKEDNAVFRLLKGGFRTVTGLIGKRGNKDAYKLRASGATIGIRGTDFTTRLCADKDCDDAAAAKKEADKPKSAGRVMRIVGRVAAKQQDGKIRRLTLGSAVYAGDTLQSDLESHAIVVFRDGGRITLQQSSVFQVEAFKYGTNDAEQENVALRLIKGGVRVVTGLIGRVNKQNYKFRMSGATIGIRGTGFDAWCNGPCASGAANFGAPPNDAMDGAGVHVWSGAVVFATPQGTMLVSLNQAAVIARESDKPVQVNLPRAIQQNAAPRPDSIPVDLDKTFDDSAAGANTGAGLYVTVHDGKVIVAQKGNKLDLGKGDSGFANNKVLTRLSATPRFMSGDSKLDTFTQQGDTGNGDKGCVVR